MGRPLDARCFPVHSRAVLQDIVYDLPRLFARLFYPRYLYWHILAIALTVLLVTSGADWQYFLASRAFKTYGLLAAVVGFFAPVAVPCFFYAWSWYRSLPALREAAIRLAQAELLGYLVSICYKAVTGRAAPLFYSYSLTGDTSRDFHFGFWGNGVFWGWPSSHTAVAFAMAAALVLLFPKSRLIRLVAPLYALLIGLGVSVSIHWFSDFIAGALLGILAGYIAAKNAYVDVRR
jgi:membrane-associated phospholipid phosphatase